MSEVNRTSNKYCRRCQRTVPWRAPSVPVENVRQPIEFSCIGGNTAALCGLREEDQRRDA